MGVENEAPFDINRFYWWVVSNQDGLLGILANKNKEGVGLRWNGATRAEPLETELLLSIIKQTKLMK